MGDVCPADMWSRGLLAAMGPLASPGIVCVSVWASGGVVWWGGVGGRGRRRAMVPSVSPVEPLVLPDSPDGAQAVGSRAGLVEGEGRGGRPPSVSPVEPLVLPASPDSVWGGEGRFCWVMPPFSVVGCWCGGGEVMVALTQFCPLGISSLSCISAFSLVDARRGLGSMEDPTRACLYVRAYASPESKNGDEKIDGCDACICRDTLLKSKSESEDPKRAAAIGKA